MAQLNEMTKNDVTRSDAVSKLRITVLSASNLPRSSFIRGDSKAFVVLHVLDQTWRTKGAERSRSPRWDEEFDLQGDNSSALKIELRVIRRQTFFSRREQLVGVAEVQFEDLRRKQRQAYGQ
ncbi:hypothetical protein BOTBODRAFT_443622 [Botryobasidium botryosum FD-172 SS1]|uniref:C2 domain-containing protein n=1 Tax=Botryobasidium botryosum (strain FD-172 SS1) TaxID=930990 RepID=A0A067MY10_BOTB1|nr:hypothetical protein BOTBODRAFT_443622 [Botryobasidium botryosum FD-172 SS1]